ncbi:unnamed protein product [Diabrotica balteata]|uniref:DNA/RNA non-specific endonuclease/pyrophosphatase/phosphodiesterase domain-containing protein n=1 Tax=Diabrotica balteata TaxID=107213 RepID=A0A9N9XGP7_DIABA|nr:unnamed protein product [Diabrotica balteata]
MVENTTNEPEFKTSITTETSVSTTQFTENPITEPELKTSITTDTSVSTIQSTENPIIEPEYKTSISTDASVFTTQIEDDSTIKPEFKTSTTTKAPGFCEINQIQYSNTAPLLLSPNTQNIIYPQGKATTIFATNEEVEFSCPQSQVRANGVNLDSTIIVVCKSKETFTYNGINIEWKNVLCSKSLVPTINEISVKNLSIDDPNKPCDIGDDSLPDDSDKYINNNAFITTQQLASENDFYSASFQLAVKNYANIAPQWNSINNGNWLQESEIRMYASNKNVNLQIWSGTYGVTKLNNETTELIDLYLFEREIRKQLVKAFPVPELYWKIVYNPLNTQGIVLIGHNNPYVGKVSPEEQICDDISSKLNWISWDKELYDKGYFYACDYNDDKFQSIVHFAPKLKITGYL